MRAGIRDAAAGVLVMVAVIGMAGCVPEGGVPSLPPTPTSTPVFASEEEALAAAEDAYAAYLDMSNLISAQGGQSPERIEEVATGDLLALSLEGFQTLRDRGWRWEGDSELKGATLQYALLDSGEATEIIGAYVCVDFTNVDVLDATGTSVVSPDRPNLQAFEVFFDLTADSGLIPSSRDAWDNSVCGP